jgi:hypothetical protein
LFYAGILKQIYIKDNKVPVKGGEIQIGCDIVHFSDADTVRVYKTDSILTSDLTTAQSLANCYPTSCFGTQPRHKFSSSNSGVTIKITNLDSSDDKKYWTCVMNNQQMYMQLTVYCMLYFSLQFCQEQPTKINVYRIVYDIYF